MVTITTPSPAKSVASTTFPGADSEGVCQTFTATPSALTIAPPPELTREVATGGVTEGSSAGVALGPDVGDAIDVGDAVDVGGVVDDGPTLLCADGEADGFVDTPPGALEEGSPSPSSTTAATIATTATTAADVATARRTGRFERRGSPAAAV